MPLAPLHREPDARRLPAVAYLEVIFPTPTYPNGRTIGTGCVIAPRLILTAAHIVYDHRQGGQALRVFVSLPTVANTIDTTEVDFPRQWRGARAPPDRPPPPPAGRGGGGGAGARAPPGAARRSRAA